MRKATIIFSAVLVLTLYSCKKKDYIINYQNPGYIDDIIKADILKPVLLADSNDLTMVVVSINGRADSQYTSVSIHLDEGFLANGKKDSTYSLNADKKVSFSVQSSLNPGNFMLYAKVSNYQIESQFLQEMSYPDQIIFDQSYIVTSDSTVQIELDLFKQKGRVSNNVPVFLTYEAVDTNGVLLNVAQSILVKNKKQSVSVSNPAKVKGKFLVIFKALNTKMDTIQNHVTIDYI